MQKLSSGAKLTIINGVDEKGPAAFLVEVEGRRLLLDIGLYGDHYPDPALLAPIDAILISHCHPDHAGALGLIEMLDWPHVHATEATWARLPSHVVPPGRQRRLPLRGTVLIGDVPVQTGRSGHAPGGVWVHLQIGGGLLYMGDWSIESQLFPFDMPPPSELVITDASYHDRVESLVRQIEAVIAEAQHGGIMPVAANGRGPEMAMRLTTLGLKPKICPLLRAEIDRYLGPERHLLKTEAVSTFETFAADVEIAEAGTVTSEDLVLVIDSAAENSLFQALNARRLDGLRFIYTGQALTPDSDPADGPAPLWQPWNIHPTPQHNAKLLSRVKAQRVVPAFSPLAKLRLFARLCEGVTVVTDREIEI